MSNDDQEIQMVEVPRHDVVVTMEDILVPLTQAQARLATENAASMQNPDVAAQVARFAELASELLEVTRSINQADPALLAPPSSPTSSD